MLENESEKALSVGDREESALAYLESDGGEAMACSCRKENWKRKTSEKEREQETRKQKKKSWTSSPPPLFFSLPLSSPPGWQGSFSFFPVLVSGFFIFFVYKQKERRRQPALALESLRYNQIWKVFFISSFAKERGEQCWFFLSFWRFVLSPN